MIRIIFWVYRQFVSPMLGNRCRFYPSCSHYSEMALVKHGWMCGLGLTLWRLVKCQPFHPGGHDPVP